ncbi:MAG: sugar phosphate nucleotidyltransferase, partial [Planctomycetota bacterium]
VVLGDNIFRDSLDKYAQNFINQKSGARIILKQVQNPQRFGIAEIENGKIVQIEEKPRKSKSDYAVTGIYFYDSSVFEIIRALKPSARGELEVTDINNAYLARQQLAYDIMAGWWSDAGTFESLKRVNELIAKEPPK